MPIRHVVRQGECISSIASRYGHFPKTIWDDPANAELKRLRKDMNTLAKGDELTIPDKRAKQVDGGTDTRHRFRRVGVPARLKLRVQRNGAAMTNAPFILVVDGSLQDGTTTADGDVDVPIPPGAREALLTVGEGEDIVEYRLNLGHMEPIDTVAGVQARLQCLGFEVGAANGTLNEETRAALRAFQDRNGLEVTGEIDEATRARLQELHDVEG